MSIEILNEKTKLEKTNTLIQHPQNVNQGDLEAIKNSIEHNGFYGTVIVQKSTRHVIAGNHRVQAALELELESIPVTWLDVDNDRALRILLADNKTARDGKNDNEKLIKLLEELEQSEKEFLGTGYNDNDLKTLLLSLTSNLTEENLNTNPQLGETEFKILVTLKNEIEQSQLLQSL